LNNTYYFTPWENKFLDSISYVNDTLILVAPFIKLTVIKKIISSLPKDKKTKLILISRFSKQVFTQKSSDLSLFDFLINNEFDNLECYCYKLNKLHSKIYIIDDDKMYITSSNLSYSGLIKNHEVAVEIKEKQDISHIKNEILDLAIPKALIHNTDIETMIENLQVSSYNLLKESKEIPVPLEEIIDEDVTIADEVTEIITSTFEEENLSISKQLEYNKLLKDINEYKSQRHILDLSSLDNEQFQTIALKKIEIDSQINENAKKDFNRLKLHLITTFSKIIPIIDNELLLSDLVSCFIHSSWHNKFKYINSSFSYERKPFFQRIGKAIFWFTLALSVTKTRLFKQGSNKSFDDIYKYMRLNYPFSEALESVKCNIYFYNSDIQKNYAENIFYELMGVFYWHLGLEKFQYIFNNHFNYIDEYIYDDYKSYEFKTFLQEITQQKFGLPKYIEINSIGQDHQKVFEFEVHINGHFLASGKGISKKHAQENAAQEAIKIFIKKYGYEEKIETHIHLQKYIIDNNRKNELNKLNIILSKKITNLALLDVAFTHISCVYKNRYSRANNSLSFLGSILENLCRTIGIIKSFKKLDTSTNKDYIKIEQNIKVSATFEAYFDKNMFHKYFNYNTVSANKVTTSMKSGVIQALIGIHFLEYGLPSTIALVKEIWNDYKIAENQQGYVTTLQEHLQNKQFAVKSDEIKYIIMSERGLDNQKIFKIGCNIKGKLYGIGESTTKKESRRIAAQKTLESQEFKSDFLLQDDI